jgi:predicted ArsR family transcriptional regulator
MSRRDVATHRSQIARRDVAALRSQAARNRVLGDPSRLTIMETLAEGPHLINELAEITRLHRNTVRAHLARLERAGLIEATRRAPVGPGQPAIEYRLADGLAPSGAEQRLLIQALLRLVAGAYRAGAGELATAEGERIGRELGSGSIFPTAAQAVRHVTKVLRQLAFSPKLSSRGGAAAITLHSCPFEVEADDPRGIIVCAFHLGLIRGVVQASAPDGERHQVRLLPHVEPQLCRAEISFG